MHKTIFISLFLFVIPITPMKKKVFSSDQAQKTEATETLDNNALPPKETCSILACCQFIISAYLDLMQHDLISSEHEN